MKRILIVLTIVCSHVVLFAQTISLYFPHFAGTEYDFYVFQGTSNDTIQRGAIGEDGRLTLTIPNQYKDYQGMSRWRLSNGGGLDFVVNGNDFSVSCTEAMPNDENIRYEGSKENEFTDAYYPRQQALFQKQDALTRMLNAYGKEQEHPIFSLLKAEKERQDSLFVALSGEAIESPLYSARFQRINNFLNRYPMYAMPTNPEEQQADRNHYITEELSMDALYTSGLWKEVITQAAAMYQNTDDFLPAMINNLNRTKSTVVYEHLAEALISIFEQYDWISETEALARFINEDGRIKEPQGKLQLLLTVFKLGKGSKAPKLTQGRLPKKNTLLVFFESGCGSCENEMQQLVANYPLLQEKGYEVISIAADNDPDIYQAIAETFPWKAKYCDGEGVEGKDFQNYGVIGTPTMYIIDKKGIIQGRAARLIDLGIY